MSWWSQESKRRRAHALGRWALAARHAQRARTQSGCRGWCWARRTAADSLLGAYVELALGTAASVQAAASRGHSAATHICLLAQLLTLTAQN